MDTSSVENGMITRSDTPLRVINSSPEAIAKAKKRARLSFRQIRTENIFNKTLILMGLIIVLLVLGIFLTLVVQSLPRSAAGCADIRQWNALYTRRIRASPA